MHNKKLSPEERQKREQFERITEAAQAHDPDNLVPYAEIKAENYVPPSHHDYTEHQHQLVDMVRVLQCISLALSDCIDGIVGCSPHHVEYKRSLNGLAPLNKELKRVVKQGIEQAYVMAMLHDNGLKVK